MWTRTAKGVIQSDLLGGFPWLLHGFGTRHSGDWPGEYASLKQIHSDKVLIASQPGGCIGEGDALVTSRPGTRIGIRTADCAPLIFVDPVRRAVAAAHAGWRGTVSEIAKRTLERMKFQFGSEPADVHAAIGPCIGPCCFQVGREVASQFERYFAGAANLTHIDLAEANIRQLQEAGVPLDQIARSGQCTMCNATLFHSFRRDKHEAGRLVSAIEVVEG